MIQAAAPRVVAAIDVGSSAVRLSIARVASGGRLEPLLQHRLPVRLGAQVFVAEAAPGLDAADPRPGAGAIDAALAGELVTALRELVGLCKKHGVTHLWAVATSALRDARNQQEILAQVAREAQLTLQVLDGAEEARLSRSALAATLTEQGVDARTVQDACLFVDLGGGSLEMEGAAGRPSVSLPLGTVRLLAERPQLAQPATAARATQVLTGHRQWVRHKLSAALADGATAFVRPATCPWQLVGTGGNLEIMAALLPEPAATGQGQHRRVCLAGLGQLAAKVLLLSLPERVRQLRLRPDRADLILVALLVVEALVDFCRAQVLYVPGSGLRDGLLRALAAGPGAAHDVRGQPFG